MDGAGIDVAIDAFPAYLCSPVRCQGTDGRTGCLGPLQWAGWGNLGLTCPGARGEVAGGMCPGLALLSPGAGEGGALPNWARGVRHPWPAGLGTQPEVHPVWRRGSDGQRGGAEDNLGAPPPPGDPSALLLPNCVPAPACCLRAPWGSGCPLGLDPESVLGGHSSRWGGHKTRRAAAALGVAGVQDLRE